MKVVKTARGAKTAKAAQPAEETSVRRLTKLGGKSIGLTLPIELVRELGWREKQKVAVKRIRGGFEIRDWRKR